MRAIFHGLRDKSHGLGVDFSGEMIRTWIYVTDIDNRYARMVSVRKAFFDEVGLTARTHYLASTGIEASAAFPGALVIVDAYAVKGLLPGQVSFLRAADHLCPTDRYGVTFERGTAVTYGDRVHLFISGTASIDREGALLFPGDVTTQARRAIQNVEALLRKGGAGRMDVTHAIVYLRDAADRDAVAGVMEEWLPGVPTVHVRAAVCRPGWLVEIECSAIIPSSRAAFPPF
ncbi:MAG: hypothetical protein LBK12_03325, partial [Odoribacteraceae bacterium]|jgi:enamine deaminase RidA (YjgF/YER057c/UK114 family)|nr:hypothetical protein [Odoribacteraceae bacterium]